MQPLNFKFGSGTGETILHPFVLVAMLITIVLFFVLPRKYLILPFLMIMILIPRGQEFYYAGAHIFVSRIIILTGWARMMVSKGSQTRLLAGGFASADTAFLVWVLFHAFAFVMLYKEMGAVVNQVGLLWDFAGGYFLLRFLIRDRADIERTIKVFALIAIILSVCMLNERLNNVNVFGYLGGGVTIVPGVRDGAIRAQGPFAHSLLAGTFGSVLLPLFVWLWMIKSRALAVLGVLASTVITLTSASSTPVMAYAMGALCIGLWPVRHYMRWFRWSIVFVLILLNTVMKAPVWFLIARIDLVGGSSGYHRALLIDQFIRNFFDWWLIGTNNNGNWGWDMWDTCNQYVQEGEGGGLIALIAFIAVICICFSLLGKARRAQKERKQEWFYWILSASLVANVVAFFGISYFDQTRNLWFAFVAMVIAATIPGQVKKRVRERKPTGVLRNPAPVYTPPVVPEPVRLNWLSLQENGWSAPRS